MNRIHFMFALSFRFGAAVSLALATVVVAAEDVEISLIPDDPYGLDGGTSLEELYRDTVPNSALSLPAYGPRLDPQLSPEGGKASDWEKHRRAESERRIINEGEAELAIRVGDYEAASRIYAGIAAQTTNAERARKALLSLAEVYRAMDDPLRVVSVLERYQRDYPEDADLPEVLLRMGFLYRETGAPQKAVDSFFGVLKQSFDLHKSDLAGYRALTREASYQIAETYYRMHQYELASEFFTRLLRSSHEHSTERHEILSKTAYASYFAGDYRKVLLLLEPRTWQGVRASKQAEFRFLRASALWALRDREASRAEVVNLATLEIEPNEDPYWNFWWKHIGNELANDLFAQDDFAAAHKLYYTLLHLSDEPEWQLPIIFQIARCRESMGSIDEAGKIYNQILEEIISSQGEMPAGASLVVLESRVQDQIRKLSWEKELTQARKLYAPSDTEAHESFREPVITTDARSG